MAKINRGDVVECVIDDLAFGGAGVARVDGYVLFVKGAAPGDRVRAHIYKRKSKHAEAEVVEVLEPSPDRIAPPCPLFGRCGGCSWQHVRYERQLVAKQSIVEQSFAHIAGVKDVTVETIAPSPLPLRYRNKMDLTFGYSPEGERTLGFHRPRDYKRILDVDSCLLQPEILDQAVAVCRQFMTDHNLSCYDPVTHEGLLRHLMFRYAACSGEFLTVLASATPETGKEPPYAELAARLREACPGMRGFTWGANDAVADVMRIETILYEEGEGWIEEHLGDVRFRVSAQSFFQVNTLAARLLYDAIAHGLDLDDSQVVLDAYCGTGSIGIYCAAHAQSVWGLELVKEAVWDARSNAALNELTNCRFIAGDIRQTLTLALDGMGRRPDCVIVDPPRGGMHKKALGGLLAMGAPAFVYVSCNPTTLARDVGAILEEGYQLKRVQPVDLFPQTYHVETVCHFQQAP